MVNNKLLPKNSLAPPNATYSGLLECPCTTRKKKVITGPNSGTIDGNKFNPKVCAPYPTVSSSTCS